MDELEVLKKLGWTQELIDEFQKFSSVMKLGDKINAFDDSVLDNLVLESSKTELDCSYSVPVGSNSLTLS